MFLDKKQHIYVYNIKIKKIVIKYDENYGKKIKNMV